MMTTNAITIPVVFDPFVDEVVFDEDGAMGLSGMIE